MALVNSATRNWSSFEGRTRPGSVRPKARTASGWLGDGSPGRVISGSVAGSLMAKAVPVNGDDPRLLPPTTSRRYAGVTPFTSPPPGQPDLGLTLPRFVGLDYSRLAVTVCVLDTG